MKVKITADSTCDLSPELIAKYDIDIIPLSVTLGDQTYLDGVELAPDAIYTYVEQSGVLPKSSAVNIEEYDRVFRRWTGEGYAVVHFGISSGFSCSCQNATIAAQEVENVFVVDSRNLSTGQGLLVLRGAELAAEGLDAETICRRCAEDAAKVEASFVVDSIDYLYKGGRCSPLAAFGANLLKIKPCIEVKNGVMEPSKKYRGPIEKVILQYVTDRLSAREDLDPARIFITHTRCDPECVRQVEQTIRAVAPGFREILETTAGSTITTHCGPNTLGVLFFRK